MLLHNLRSPTRFHPGSGAMECHVRRSVEVRVSGGVEIAGIADDITLEVYDKSIEEVELTTAYPIKVVEAWMRSRELELLITKPRWWL